MGQLRVTREAGILYFTQGEVQGTFKRRHSWSHKREILVVAEVQWWLMIYWWSINLKKIQASEVKSSGEKQNHLFEKNKKCIIIFVVLALCCNFQNNDELLLEILANSWGAHSEAMQVQPVLLQIRK